MARSAQHIALFGPDPKPTPTGMGMGTPGANEDPRADQDARAKELGIELEPGEGPVLLSDGTVYQEARYVVNKPIVAPPAPDRRAGTQLARRLAEADKQVALREQELADATKALDDARAARGQHPNAPETRAQLERCLSVLAIATEDHRACVAGRDLLAAGIKAKAQLVQEFDAAELAARPETLKAAIAAQLAEAEELARRLAAIAKSVEPAVQAALRARTQGEHLADQLGITFHDRGTDMQTATLQIALAFQKGWREGGGGMTSVRRFTGN